MAGPRPPAVEVSARQRAILEHLARRATSPQRLVRRVRIILAAADGLKTDQIARRFGLARETVQGWRDRWVAVGPELAAVESGGEDEGALPRRVVAVLDDAPRSGTPPTFSAEQICQVLALACEPPEASGRPVTHWTPTDLADEAAKRGIVASISPRTVGRFLKMGPTSSPTARPTG